MDLKNKKVIDVVTIEVGTQGRSQRITAMTFVQAQNRVLLGNSKGELFEIKLQSNLERKARAIKMVKNGPIIGMFTASDELVIASEDQHIGYWKIDHLSDGELSAKEGLAAKFHKNRVSSIISLGNGKVMSCGDKEGCVVWLSNPKKLVNKLSE